MKNIKWILVGLLLCWSTGAIAQTFNNLEKALIQSGNKQSMLPVILNNNDVEKKILATPCADIDYKDPLLPILKERMFKTVTDSINDGVGIAAPQIGINRKLFWVQRFDKQDAPFEFYINPTIYWYSSLKQKGPEGCLSIPDIRGDVIRSYAIGISYFKEDGSFHSETVEGFTAVIFQHEYDHLLGILFPQRLEEQNTKTYQPIKDTKQQLLLETP